MRLDIKEATSGTILESQASNYTSRSQDDLKHADNSLSDIERYFEPNPNVPELMRPKVIFDARDSASDEESEAPRAAPTIPVPFSTSTTRYVNPPNVSKNLKFLNRSRNK